jgi:hypothetical protein
MTPSSIVTVLPTTISNNVVINNFIICLFGCQIFVNNGTIITALPFTMTSATATVSPTTTLPPPGVCTTVTAIPTEDCFTVIVCGVNVSSVHETFHHMMHNSHHSGLVITSNSDDLVDPKNLNVDMPFYDTDSQGSFSDPLFADDASFIRAASHAFESDPNSSDADPSRSSKEGAGLPKSNLDQPNEQERRERSQHVRSQDNIHSGGEAEMRGRSKKYKTGKGKLQKMGNAGNPSINNASLSCIMLVMSLVALIVNV